MAYFSARLKLLFSSDGVSLGLDSKEPFRHGLLAASFGGYNGGLRSVRLRKSRLRFNGYGTRVYSLSSSKKKRYRYLDDAEKNLGVDDEEDDESFDGDDDGFQTDELACFRGLVLDISYRPINVVCWKRAICLEFMEKADVLEYYDRTVNSPTGSFYIPAVLRVPHLLQVVKRRRTRNSLSRKNILLRDDYTCQYCSCHENLTIDHVLPVSRGGEWKWENLVAACAKCNSKKGQKTLDEANMKLVKAPKAPKDYDILAIPLTSSAIRMLRSRNGMPEEWRQYLGKPLSGP